MHTIPVVGRDNFALRDVSLSTINEPPHACKHLHTGHGQRKRH